MWPAPWRMPPAACLRRTGWWPSDRDSWALWSGRRASRRRGPYQWHRDCLPRPGTVTGVAGGSSTTPGRPGRRRRRRGSRWPVLVAQAGTMRPSLNDRDPGYVSLNFILQHYLSQPSLGYQATARPRSGCFAVGREVLLPVRGKDAELYVD